MDGTRGGRQAFLRSSAQNLSFKPQFALSWFKTKEFLLLTEFQNWFLFIIQDFLLRVFL